MSRSGGDAIRSIKRYTALHFAEPWDIRLASEEGAFERPSIIVDFAGPQTTSGPRHTMTLVRPFALYAYPVTADSPTEAKLIMADMEDQMLLAFQRGGHGGHPRRIPLYDYVGIPFDGGVKDDAVIEGYIRVMEFSTRPIQDSEDESLWAVLGSLRCTWNRPAEALPDGPLTGSVGASGP